MQRGVVVREDRIACGKGVYIPRVADETAAGGMATKRRRPADGGGGSGGETKERETPKRPDKRARAAAAEATRPRAAVGDTKPKLTGADAERAATGEAGATAADKGSPRTKRDTPRRVKRARATSPPPPASRVVSPPVKLRRASSAAGVDARVHGEDEQEEKPRVAAVRVAAVRVPSFDGDDIPKENREEDLSPPACRNLADELRLQDARTPRKDSEDAKRHALLRSMQVTPPPSARMLDKKNPPPPPPRPKLRRYIRRANAIAAATGVTYARTYPRLALSPLVDSPPTSPTSPQRVFRSLADDFMAVQDTPQQIPRVRPEPQMARGSRRSSRSASGRRSIDTPTSTMVLRSRQLNHNTQPSMSKPENAREREQREFHERERRNT